MEIMSKLSERLKEVMFEKNFKAADLAKQVGVNRNTITRYMQGVRLPTFDNFIKMLDVLNCSADFLVGLVDFPPESLVFHPAPPFHERFRELLQLFNFTQYKLHKKTQLSYDDYNKWLKGASTPYVDSLVKLAQAFDCSVDFVLGRIR